MSWLSEFLDSVMGTGALKQQIASSQATTDAASATALTAQQDAQARAELAATPALDQEGTRVAGETQMRKMLAAAGFRFSGQPLGDAPLGFSKTYGE